MGLRILNNVLASGIARLITRLDFEVSSQNDEGFVVVYSVHAKFSNEGTGLLMCEKGQCSPSPPTPHKFPIKCVGMHIGHSLSF